MKKAEQASPNRRLREARKKSYLTQSQVAERVGTTVVNVNRWESGATIPSLYFRQKLCGLFGKSPEELGLIPEAERQEQTAAAVATPIHWNVPYRRNPYFTGRQEVLGRLEAVLHKGTPAALVQTQAISGLGGIGKTQTAVEYAYRYQGNYRAVLWAKAETREILTADFVELTALLNLPEKDEQDQSRAVGAVKRWLKDYPDWLLILDNVEDVELASDFLPSDSKGHILLTTRAQSTGTVAQRIELEKLEPEEGALLLLRRAKRLASDIPLEQASASDRIKALELSRLMDGLPLALDQAAAYIEETECGLTGYLERYQTRRARLLNLRGSAASDHPEAVAATWSLSFEKVQKANPAAADLMRLCAFLHPDAIAEEIIIEGASELSLTLGAIANDPLELDAAIRELRKFSLLRRDPEGRQLMVHRLVQAVLKDGLDEDAKRQWAERTVRAVNQAFPNVEFASWQRCQRLIPQAQSCAENIREWNMVFPEAARLLDQAGSYLNERGQYTEAEALFQQAIAIWEKSLGPGHPDLAKGLNDLASLYTFQSKPERAEPLYQRALAIREKALGSEHPDVATTINDLAIVYLEQGKFEQAEPLYQRALTIREQELGPDHPDVATSLNDFAVLYVEQGKFEKAEEFYHRSLKIWEKALGPEHPDVAANMNNLALLYHRQGKYEQAEHFFLQSLHIVEKGLGPGHPHVASCLGNLAMLYRDQGNYKQAENLFVRAFEIWEKELGPDHRQVAATLNNLALVYTRQHKYEQAEPLFQRALQILENKLGPEHLFVGKTLDNLAELYSIQGKYVEAEPLFNRVLTIFEHSVGSEHPETAICLNRLARLYHAQDKYEQAEAFLQRALTIQEQRLNSVHPDIAQTVNDLAQLYVDQGNYTRAELFYQRALAIRGQSLRTGHPDLVSSLRGYAALLRKTNRETEAAELEVRAKAIREKDNQENNAYKLPG